MLSPPWAAVRPFAFPDFQFFTPNNTILKWNQYPAGPRSIPGSGITR